MITEPQPKRSEHKVSNTWLDKTGKEYCQWLDKQPLANHTKRTYESRLTAFVDFLIWEQRTAPITEQTKDAPVRAFKHYLKRTRKVKPATVNSYIAAINNFYGFLGIGATTVHPEDLPTEAPAALPKEDQKKLLRAIETTPRIKDRAILTLLFFTGIRISECAALEMDDVFVVGRKTKIIVRAGKGDHYREIPLNSLVCEVLLKWISERRRKFEDREISDAFFVNPQGNALTTSGIDLIVRKVGQSCGLDLSAHQLRHTLLTNLVRNNKDIVLVADVAGRKNLLNKGSFAGRDWGEAGCIAAFDLFAVEGARDIKETPDYRCPEEATQRKVLYSLRSVVNSSITEVLQEARLIGRYDIKSGATRKLMVTSRKILIIAGPNGAGKSTFAREFLPNEAECPAFVNADLIAAGLSPFQPELAAIKAGKLMLKEMAEHVERDRSFAFETTLAGRGYVQMIRDWRKQGYKVKLFFLSLASPEEAIARIAERVAQGGHNVPADVVRRRFDAGLTNFKSIYRFEVNYWRWYDNSGDTPAVIDQGENL